MRRRFLRLFVLGSITLIPIATGCASTLRRIAPILRAEDRRVVDDALLAGLKDSDTEVRARAVGAVGRIGAPGAASLLREALLDRDPAVRSEAAFGLGQIADPATIPALSVAAEDGIAAVRSRVAESIGKIHDPSGAATLGRLIKDPDVDVQAAACLATWKFADPAFALDSLIELSSSPSERARFASAYALGRLGSAGVNPAPAGAAQPKMSDEDRKRVRGRLVELGTSDDSEIKMQVARGLASPGSPAEIAMLGGLTTDPDPRVRVNAVRSLSYAKAPLDPYLRKTLAARELPVVQAAVEGLGRIATAEAVEILVKGILRDKRPWLRQTGLQALLQADRNLAAQGADVLAKDPDPVLRAGAARSLAGRTDPKSAQILGDLLKDASPRVVEAAVLARAEAPGALAELLGDSPASPDPAVRGAVAQAAGKRLAQAELPAEQREEAFALLERQWKLAASDPLPVARLETLDAAVFAGKDPRAHALLTVGLDDRDRLVRLRAIGHLRRVFDENASLKAGPASGEPLEHYVEVLRWARKPRAAIVTVQRPGFDTGRFTLALDSREAPLAAWNFARLADSKFYDGLVVHRVVPNFVVQDGDPRGDGNGDPGYSIRDEINSLRFTAGTLGMASAGPDTAGSQWFVALSAQPHLDGRYTAFGRVVQNFPGVLAQIQPDDRVVSIRIYEGDGTEPLPPR